MWQHCITDNCFLDLTITAMLIDRPYIKNIIMNKFTLMIYLLILLNLDLSCVQPETNKGDNIVTDTSNVDMILNMEKDTLVFTSGIRSIFQDSRGNYWFGSHQEGVCLFDGKTFNYFTTDDGLSDNQVRSIQEDKNGIIWFETGNGVSNYDGKNIKSPISKNILDPNELLSNKWEKTGKDLWFNAGNSNGVYRYDGQKLNYLSFPKAKLINHNNVYHVTGFSKGKNNQIWIATFAGVFGYNGKAFTIINDESLGLNDESGFLHIRSILEDRKGNLWIGNNGIGVLLNNGDTTINFSEKNGLIHFFSSRGGGKSLAGTLEHVFAIEEDSEGNIWFGDRDTGAWKFDGKTMTNYIIDPKLSTQMIWDIYEDNDKNLYFAMGNGGVYEFNGKSFDRKY